MALAVAESQFRELSHNATELDFVRLSLASLLFLYLCEKPSQADLGRLATLLEAIPRAGRAGGSVQALTEALMAMDRDTYVASALIDVVKALASENMDDLFRLG